MTSQLMNHDEAVKTLATERYLLREMNDDERRAFEEHYLACAECFEAVMFGSDFVNEIPNVKLPAPALTFREKLARVLSSLTRPVPALAFGLVLCFAGLAYQATVISQLKHAEETQVATAEFRYVLTGIAHGSSDTKLVQAPENSVVSLGVEYKRSGEFVSYSAKVVSDSGKVKQTLDLPNVSGNLATIALLPRSLNPGPYSLVILGRTATGTDVEVGRGNFLLQITAK